MSLVRLNHASVTRLIAACATIFGSSAALSQATPGSVPSREQIELPRLDPPRPGSQVNVRGEQAIAACPLSTSDVQVEISRLSYTSADGEPLPPQILDLLRPVRPSPGSRPVGALCALRDAAGQRLHEAGYVAAVQIPPQEITAGEAVLQVVLARLVDVQVEGAPGPYEATLDARIRRLKALDPLNRFEAERILLLANDVPGLNVGLALRSAGARQGEVIGVLTIAYSPWTVVANAQNYGSRQIGRESATLRGEYYGLTGLSDRTFVGVSSTIDLDEQQVVQGGHYFGLGSGGTTAGARLSYAWSRPDVGALDLRSRSLIAGLDLTAPVIRSVTRDASIGGGLELIEQRVRLHGNGGSLALNRDKLRVAYLRIAGTMHEPRPAGGDAWALSASVEVRQGLDLLGATERGEISPEGYSPTRFDGDPTATVIRSGIDGFVALGPIFSLAGSMQSQWSSGPLLSFEEFSVGNLTIGRGYDPGVTAGDQALAFRIEPRAQVPLGPDIGTQIFAFYDNVTIWNDDRFTTEADRTLVSWGAGLRALLPGRLSLEAFYARPEDKGLATHARRASGRFLISLTAQFSPRAPAR